MQKQLEYNGLITITELENLIHQDLNGTIMHSANHLFQGAPYNKGNFDKLMLFLDDRLFAQLTLRIFHIDRWVNAYYWCCAYLLELKIQGIVADHHLNLKYKVIERINQFATSEHYWEVIQDIDNRFQ